MAKAKKDIAYRIEFSQLNGRDTNTFIASEMEVLDNGYVKAVGHYKRERNVSTLLIPNSTVICITETQAEAVEENQTEENV